MNVQNVTMNFFGKELTIETGKLAKQADGAVTVRLGDTIVLVTVVASKSVKDDQDFFPLTVDYRERFTAAGKFKGGYLKRESKPTQKEILVARLTDRPLRPLFADGFLNEVQVDVMVISADQKNDSDVLTTIGASAALCLSSIPFNGPVGGVRVGRVDGKLIINPTVEERSKSDIELMMAGNEMGILMVEGFANLISEEEVLEALDFGYDAIKVLLDFQKQLINKLPSKKAEWKLFPVDKELVKIIKSKVSESNLKEALYIKGKHERSEALETILNDLIAKITEENPDISQAKIKSTFKEVEKELLRKIILSEGIRADGRGLRDIRKIWIETGLLPCTHGSAVFTRGETQALAVATLGGSKDSQKAEDINADIEEHFYLHYNFPGFSVGECKPNRGPGRREIGHGELAQRGLTPVVPKKTEFPYVIRLTSDILESNGSSSMATVCAGTLAMMDAGVPIKQSVSGIAMGLIKEDDKVAILSDILGLEDSLGDMDFKVIGTRNGISAFQMDIKIEGLTRDIMKQALKQATEGRLHILSEMDKALSSPRELSKNAPSIIHIKVPTEKIGFIIGPGGKNIRGLSEKFGVAIDITDDGIVTIQCDDSAKALLAKEEIQLSISEIEKDKVYKGIVKSITPFGAFVECLPGKEALLHISRISKDRINQVTDVLKEGDEIEVKCIDIDEKGRAVLSRKALL
ncbi:MAG: hypothetical protein ACD_79C00762G0003 [uncultured bacterium]|nr:MAG: hypothetical protein ACD_79C00762G0003 [uncultured bacterium]